MKREREMIAPAGAERTMICGFCGYEFDESEGKKGCGGCPGGCHSIHCPRCNYKNPPEAAVIKKLKDIFHKGGKR